MCFVEIIVILQSILTFEMAFHENWEMGIRNRHCCVLSFNIWKRVLFLMFTFDVLLAENLVITLPNRQIKHYRSALFSICEKKKENMVKNIHRHTYWHMTYRHGWRIHAVSSPLLLMQGFLLFFYSTTENYRCAKNKTMKVKLWKSVEIFSTHFFLN